jgi:hypothetical protein
MQELGVTLFRFGLDNLEKKQLAALFASVAGERSDGLALDGFVKFVEAAISTNTADFVEPAPDGWIPSWWQRSLRELRHYRTGFRLLIAQTKSAVSLVVACRSQVNANDRRLVLIAALDFGKCLPFAVLMLAPGGSILLPVLMKMLPSLLPTTFHVPVQDGTHKNIAASLEVATRILHLESQLRKVRSESPDSRAPGT